MATAKKTTKSAAPKTKAAPKPKKAKEPAAQAVKTAASATGNDAAAQAAAVSKSASDLAVKKQAQSPAVKQAAHSPAMKEKAAAPAVKATAQSPAVKEKAASPAVQENAQSPAVKAAAQSPAVKAEAKVPAAQNAAPAADKNAKVAAPKVPAAAEAAPKASAQPEAAAKTETPAAPQAKSLREITPRPMPAGNPYLPMAATVKEVIQETGNIKTIRVVLDDPKAMASFTYQPGQVGQLSVFGAGESTFVINTPPSCKDYLQFSVMQAGEVTSAIHRLSAGDKVGVRAPLGNYFPYEQWKGKDIVFVGGGIGMAPIRTIMLHLLEHKQDYGKISLLYGARSPRDMAFSYELDGWMNNPDLDCNLCIDAPFEGWPHKVGLIPNVLLEMAPKAENCVAVLCGPPIMIKFTVQALEKLGFAPENIVTTLEKRMKCGVGICGRCNIGGKYVCVDGPVFSWAELKKLPADM